MTTTTTDKTLFDKLTESQKQAVIEKYFSKFIISRSYLVDDLVFNHGYDYDLMDGEYNWENVENHFRDVNDSDDCECGEYYSSQKDDREWDKDLCNCDKDPQDIYEWYEVTDLAYDSLKAIDECVLKTSHGHFWGRGCTGQSWVIDYAPRQIFNKLDTLYQRIWIKEAFGQLPEGLED